MPILRSWNDLEETPAGLDVAKRTLTGAGATWVRVAIKAGARAERHEHAFEQLVQVLSGGGTLETEEGAKRFSAGSLFYFAPHTWHAASFDEDTILVETNVSV